MFHTMIGGVAAALCDPTFQRATSWQMAQDAYAARGQRWAQEKRDREEARMIEKLQTEIERLKLDADRRVAEAVENEAEFCRRRHVRETETAVRLAVARTATATEAECVRVVSERASEFVNRKIDELRALYDERFSEMRAEHDDEMARQAAAHEAEARTLQTRILGMASASIEETVARHGAAAALGMIRGYNDAVDRFRERFRPGEAFYDDDAERARNGE